MSDLEQVPFIRVNDSKTVKEVKARILHNEKHLREIEKGVSNLSRTVALIRRDFEAYKRVKQY